MKKSLRPAAFFGVLLVLALVAWSRGLGNEALLHHTPTDVTDSVLDNSMLRSMKLWPRIFTGEFLLSTGGQYRPLGYAVFGLINSQITDAGGVFWHCLLLVIHLASATLVFVGLRQFLDEMPSLAMAAAWLAHPAFMPLVCDVNFIWLAGAMLMSVGSVSMFAVHMKHRCPWALLTSVILFAGALFSFRWAMVLPAFFVIIGLFGEENPRATAAAMAYMVLVSFAASLLRVPVYAVLGMSTVIAIFLAAAASVPAERFKAVGIRLLAYGAVIAVFAMVASSVEPVPLQTFYLQDYLGNTARLAEPHEPWFVNRALLTGSIMFMVALAAAAALPAVVLLAKRRVAMAVCIAPVLAATVVGLGTYRDDVAYWQRIDSASPGHVGVEINLADAYIDAGKWVPARDILNRLLYEKPDLRQDNLLQGSIKTRLGATYDGMGNQKVAGFYHFSFGSTANWYRDTMKNRLSRVSAFCFDTGYVSCAEFFWGCGKVLDPHDTRIYINLARALIYKNFFRAAEKHLRHALTIEPRNADAVYYLAFCAQALGREKDFPRLADRWQSLTGEEAIDFRKIFAKFESYDRPGMRRWFSEEPLLLAMRPDYDGLGSYNVEFRKTMYPFAEVPFEIGTHMARAGNWSDAEAYLRIAHKADPESRVILQEFIKALQTMKYDDDASAFQSVLEKLNDK